MSAYQEVTTLFCNVLFKGDVLFNYSIQNCFVNKHCTKTEVLLEGFLRYRLEEYSDPSQICKMELLAEIVNDFH